MLRNCTLIILTLFVVSSFSGPKAILSQEMTIEAQVDQYIQSLPEQFNGTILLSVGDEILLNKGYGLANRSYDIPNTAETKYRIGSITKHFTAVLTLQMAQKGLIDLDATIDTYLPYCPEKFAGKITVRHLLTHKSGIPHHYNAFPRYFGVEDRFFHTTKEYLKLLSDIELAHEPGERMTYTSPGYHLLGLVIEAASNKSYAELIEENIFKPLGMKNSSVYNNLAIQKNMATGYKEGINGFVLAEDEEESLRAGAGSILTTSGDLHLFLRTFSFEGDEILSEEYKKLFFQCHSPMLSCAGITYSFPYDGGKDTLFAVTTGGSSYGFLCNAERLIKKDVNSIVLSNIQSGPIREICSEIDNKFLLTRLGIDIGQNDQAQNSWNSASVEVDPAVLNAYAGYYRLKSGGYAVVTCENGKLFCIESLRQLGTFSSGNISPHELFPVSDSLFKVENRRGMQYCFTENSLDEGYDIAISINNRPWDEAKSVKAVADLNLSEYSGYYYSLELQRAYRFSMKDNHLITSDFPGTEKAVFVPLEKDMFGFNQGYLVFHRYEDGEIRDFKLQTPQVDDAMGSLFIKK